MKLLIIIYSLLLLSCATNQRIIYIKGENHLAYYDKQWKQFTQERAKNGEVNLFREGYFPEELISKNTYGIDDPKIYSLSNALKLFSDIEFILNDIKLNKKEREGYIQKIKNSVFLYHQIKYFKQLKNTIDMYPNKIDSLTYLRNFYKKVIYYHANTDFKKYKKELLQYINEKNFDERNITYLMNEITVKMRDVKMANNIYNKYYDINNDKDIIVIVGQKHTLGIIQLLKKRNLNVKELIINKRKKNRF